MEQVISQETNAVVEVGAEWSGASQVVLNTLSATIGQQSASLHYYHIDSEVNPIIHKLYNLDVLPALLFFRKGILVDKLSGFTNRIAISEKINQLYNI